MPPYPASWKIHFDIIPSTPSSSKSSPSLRFPHQHCVCTSPVPHSCHMSCPYHSLFDHPNYIWWAAQIIKLLIKYLRHFPVTSSLLGPNILLSNLFSNTLRLCSSRNVTHQASHPYMKQQWENSQKQQLTEEWDIIQTWIYTSTSWKKKEWIRKCGMSNLAICWGAVPGSCCLGPVPDNAAFYHKLQLQYLFTNGHCTLSSGPVPDHYA